MTAPEPIYPETFMRAVALHEALGLPNMKEMGGPWEYELDDNWFIAMNGATKETVAITPHGGRNRNGMVVDVPPVTLAVWWNGWIAGLIDPWGGVIAAGEAANEETFLAALDAAIARARPAVLEETPET